MTLTPDEMAALAKELSRMYLADPVLVALAQRLMKETR